MLRTLIVLAAIAAIVIFGLFWLLTIPATVPASALPQRTANLDNGRSMFLIGGCSSCHATPNQDDPTRLGGGLALKSPFGAFHVPNISPDAEHGIGRWSEADFASAMLKGTAPGGMHLYPAFPYTSYQRMRLDDVRDLFAYLKTLPAVQVKSLPHELAFPYNTRRMLGLWKWLFLDGQTFVPDPGKDAAWNRGAYLVNGPGHCAECHSPRNALGAIVEGQRFAGGPDPGGEGWVPNITQQHLRDWSVKDFAFMLESGMTPDDRVGGPMADVVRNISKLRDADRQAIAVYL
jgi:mono/diheme cytochrome c family protein